jgi:hypothetical protein
MGIARLALLMVLGWATMAVAAEDRACVVIDDFSRGSVGRFPDGWKPRKDSGRDVYRVVEEGGLRFLRATASGLGIQAGLTHEWDLAKYPVLAWSWRPRMFPRGGDERESATNDSVLAVYMLVPYSRITGPKAVKYVWSERVPVGARLESNMGLTKVRVLRSGGGASDDWTEERVNVLEDFQKAFGVTDPPKPAGIAVLTDADDTRSRAEGDYAGFRVCSQ